LNHKALHKKNSRTSSESAEETGIVHALVLRLCRLSTIRSARTTPFELAS